MISKGPAIAVVMLCLTVPIWVGFLWTVDSVSNNEWQPTDDLNITSDLSVADLWTEGSYTGANNNLYAFRTPVGFGTTTRFYHDPVTESTVKSPYLVYSLFPDDVITEAKSYDVQSILDRDVETVTPNMLADVYTYINNTEIANGRDNLVMFVITAQNMTSISYEGTSYHQLIYAANGRAQLISTNESVPMADVTGKDITISRLVNPIYATCIYYKVDADGNTLYAQPETGWKMEVDDYYGNPFWTNGYINHAMNLLISTADLNLATPIAMNFGGETLTISVDVNNKVNVVYGTQESQVLGDLGVYPYLLINPSCNDGWIKVYGLMGMDDFTDPYRNHLGNNVQFDFEIEGFTLIYFESGNMSYYVPQTTIYTAEGKGIKDSTVTPSSYYADNYWRFVIRNPGIFGDSITLTGSTSETYTITNGYVEIPLGVDSTLTKVKVRDLTITHIMENSEWHTYINDQIYNDNVTSIGLNGIWAMTAMLYKMELLDTEHYEWQTGTFGLDGGGYCLVGLITSVAMFLGTGLLYNSRGDMGHMIGMVLSVICGVIYLILMMSFS